MSNTAVDCILCGKTHDNPWGWRYRKWDTPDGSLWGWGCLDPGQAIVPEFTTKAIKEARREYAGDQVQSHRGGEFSREYAELYPNRTKQMIKDGALSAHEVKKAKYVWGRDLKGWDRNRKTDVSAVVKSI